MKEGGWRYNRGAWYGRISQTWYRNQSDGYGRGNQGYWWHERRV